MSLDAALLTAHDLNDLPQLVELYQQAADHAFQRQDIDAGCFYLTHAYIFALDCDHKDCLAIHRLLVAHGREAG